MHTFLSQVLVLCLTFTTLVGNVFADYMVTCDMAMSPSESSSAIAHRDHGQMDMSAMMSEEAMHEQHSMHGQHDMSSHQNNTDHANMDMNQGDCCGADCACQDGVCSTVLFVHSHAFKSPLLAQNQIIISTATLATSAISPSLFRPPIA